MIGPPTISRLLAHYGGVNQLADYKVLIPLDGSPLAEHSLAYLLGLKKFGDVVLLQPDRLTCPGP